MPIIEKIRDRLGEDSVETPTLSKKAIIHEAEGSYYTLRESIKRFPDAYGITPSVFQSLNRTLFGFNSLNPHLKLPKWFWYAVGGAVITAVVGVWLYFKKQKENRSIADSVFFTLKP